MTTRKKVATKARKIVKAPKAKAVKKTTMKKGKVTLKVAKKEKKAPSKATKSIVAKARGTKAKTTRAIRSTKVTKTVKQPAGTVKRGRGRPRKTAILELEMA